MTFIKKTLLGLSLVLSAFSMTAQASILLLEEDFNDGLATGWSLANGASVWSAPESLVLSSGGYDRVNPDIAMTPVFDLAFWSSVSITFDFDNLESSAQATRWIDLQFFNGDNWVFVTRLTETLDSFTQQTFQVSSGLSQDSQFRFIGKGPDRDRFVSVDNVTVTGVPEPQTIFLVGGFGLFLMTLRRRA